MSGKRITARQLAKYAQVVRSGRPYSTDEWARGQLDMQEPSGDVVVHVRDGAGRTVVLSRIRFGTNENGKPTERLVECVEDGKPTTYAGRYEFEVLAVFENGLKLDFTTI